MEQKLNERGPKKKKKDKYTTPFREKEAKKVLA